MKRNSNIGKVYQQAVQCIEETFDDWSKYYSKNEMENTPDISPKQLRWLFLDSIIEGDGSEMGDVLLDYPREHNFVLSDEFGALALVLVGLVGRKNHFDVLADFGFDMSTSIWHSCHEENPRDFYLIDLKSSSISGAVCVLGGNDRIDELVEWNILNPWKDKAFGGMMGGEAGILISKDKSVNLRFINEHLKNVEKTTHSQDKECLKINSNILAILTYQKLITKIRIGEIKNNKALTRQDSGFDDLLENYDEKINIILDGYKSVFKSDNSKGIWMEILQKPPFQINNETLKTSYLTFMRAIKKDLNDEDIYSDENIRLIDELLPKHEYMWSKLTEEMPVDIQKKYITENLSAIYSKLKNKLYKPANETWSLIANMMKSHTPKVHEKLMEHGGGGKWWEREDLVKITLGVMKRLEKPGIIKKRKI